MGFDEGMPAINWRPRNGRFATVLQQRGRNVEACNTIEDDNGGDSSMETPYVVATFRTRKAAQDLATRFNDIYAKASVES